MGWYFDLSAAIQRWFVSPSVFSWREKKTKPTVVLRYQYPCVNSGANFFGGKALCSSRVLPSIVYMA